jgi:hypothetical protein
METKEPWYRKEISSNHTALIPKRFPRPFSRYETYDSYFQEIYTKPFRDAGFGYQAEKTKHAVLDDLLTNGSTTLNPSDIFYKYMNPTDPWAVFLLHLDEDKINQCAAYAIRDLKLLMSLFK